MFADAEDERQQYTMVVHNVAATLKREGQPARRRRLADRRRRRCAPTATSSTSSSRTSPTTTRWCARPWAGPVTGIGTINAFVRRLLSSQRSLARLVRADVAADALAAAPHRHRRAQVTVVDLHNLDDRGEAVRRRRHAAPRVRRQGTRRASTSRCCSSCSTSSTSTRRATATRRSRRSCSTSPSAAVRSASS